MDEGKGVLVSDYLESADKRLRDSTLEEDLFEERLLQGESIRYFSKAVVIFFEVIRPALNLNPPEKWWNLKHIQKELEKISGDDRKLKQFSFSIRRLKEFRNSATHKPEEWCTLDRAQAAKRRTKDLLRQVSKYVSP